MASNDPEHREKEIGETAAGEDEDMGARIPPIIRLKEVTVTTGAEDVDVLLDMKAMLYQFDDEIKWWVVRGTGYVKILKHKKFDSTQIVMWQRKTLKICANHFILPYIKVQEHSIEEKCCVWHAIDYSDEEFIDVMFCIRFASVDNCKLFLETVEKQAKAFGKKEEKENKKVDATVKEFDKLSVDKGNNEEKALEEETTTFGPNEKEEEKKKEEKAETKMASNDPEHREMEIGDTAIGEDEGMGAYIPPIVRLKAVIVTTGAEDVDVLLDMKAKLYQFDKEINKWMVRGTGYMKILKHKQFDSAQIVMWQSKTLKICANHFILPSIKLQEHSENVKSCVWHAIDYSDEEFNDVTFRIQFASVDNCKLFMETVEKQAEAFGKKEEKENKKVDVAAGEFEKLSVGKSNREEKAVEEETATSGSNDKEEEKEKEEKAET